MLDIAVQIAPSRIAVFVMSAGLPDHLLIAAPILSTRIQVGDAEVSAAPDRMSVTHTAETLIAVVTWLTHWPGTAMSTSSLWLGKAQILAAIKTICVASA
jgi:hypothetical protein